MAPERVVEMAKLCSKLGKIIPKPNRPKPKQANKMSKELKRMVR